MDCGCNILLGMCGNFQHGCIGNGISRFWPTRLWHRAAKAQLELSWCSSCCHHAIHATSTILTCSGTCSIKTLSNVLPANDAFPRHDGLFVAHSDWSKSPSRAFTWNETARFSIPKCIFDSLSRFYCRLDIVKSFLGGKWKLAYTEKSSTRYFVQGLDQYKTRCGRWIGVSRLEDIETNGSTTLVVKHFQ